MGKERPSGRKARAYLAEFEKWLHDRRPDRSREKRDSTLADLVDGVVPSVEEELATAERCRVCGGPILRSQTATGPRSDYCCQDCKVKASSGWRP